MSPTRIDQNTSPMVLCDFYKTGHVDQYPEKTEAVYSTWIARASLLPGVTKAVAFGFQRFVAKWFVKYFNEEFFSKPWDELEREYIRIMKHTLFIEPKTDHWKALHDLGYLPLRIRAVPEGTLVPLRVPMLTIENTLPEFFWLTNFVETLFSCEDWSPTVSATIAHEFRKVFDHYASITNPEALVPIPGLGVPFTALQGHDFSMRGMEGIGGAELSGIGHLLSFVGTDTIPAILELERFYGADIELELVGTSIPATEHSVMCAGGHDNELETYRRLLRLYTSGPFSAVSDTWDLWKVICQTLGIDLHDLIMERDGKLVIRPDSGDPVKILCGDLDAEPGSPAYKGVVELVWDLFGGTLSSTGFKVITEKLGIIYGDGINLVRQLAICIRLMEKGFASTNWVGGIGSYSYQLQTRDTLGIAMKATDVTLDGIEFAIFKDPITDDGTKKSLTGRVYVDNTPNHGIIATDGFTIDGLEHAEDTLGPSMLAVIFEDGVITRFETIAAIRATLTAGREAELAAA